MARGNSETYKFQTIDPMTSLHQRFEAQVNRTPGALAVVYPSPDDELSRQELTYHQLNAGANQLAHHLRRWGVGPDVPVAICLERSVDMVIAILAVLKAGGAYVPLELAYPKERLAFILADAQAPVLITHTTLLKKLPDYNGHKIYLDTVSDILAQLPADNPGGNVTPGNLAYIIYTSGSTGQPKGVLIEHRNVTRLFDATNAWFNFNEDDVWSLFHSYAFDFSVWELWGALLYGGRLVIVPYWTSRSPEAFYQLLAAEQVTVLNQTPSAFRQLIQAEEHAGTPESLSLRVVIFGGEALELNSLRPWFERHGDQTPQLINMYGITETTVHVTYRPLTMGDVERGQGSVIGGPIPDLSLYVLDDQHQPVLPGEVGELYVGGAGVARGYLNRPDLTNERFIKNPFTSDSNERLYKSGDLARLLPDGDLEYLGRIDHQVKIRGFRIELGEIEAALHQHPHIRESAVLAVEDATGQTRLVAYIVPVDEPPPMNALRQFLAATLPDYMIPAFFISVDKFPLTPNGKIDRKALPPPTVERPKLATGYKAPQTRLEQLLASLWQTVLGVDKVGTEDNFFELGGDSLKGAMVINKLQAELGEYLYIVALFEAPTITELTIYLKRKYPRGVARLTGDDDEAMPPEAVERITGADVAQVKGLIRPLAPGRSGPDRVKNPPAIFVLTTPRSGSTLFRVMLAGHPDLYAPPELDLLLFNTLAERKQGLTGGDAFRLEGTIRALMDIKGDGVEQARNRMAEYEALGVTTQAFYGCLQEWVAPRRLVDKSTFYALDLAALKRIEVDFENALYIHLVRHPYGMIHSFEKARLDRIFFKDQHRFNVRQIAEITWLICQQNITHFLQMVPAVRHHQIRYEDLVRQPQATMESLCHFLELDMHPGLLEPYADKTTRMTDGLHAEAEARMLGDVKFHEHKAIDPNIADTWRAQYTADFLGDPTVEMAEALGYELIAQSSTVEAGIRALPREAKSNHTGQVTDDIDDLIAHLSDEEIEELLK